MATHPSCSAFCGRHRVVGIYTSATAGRSGGQLRETPLAIPVPLRAHSRPKMVNNPPAWWLRFCHGSVPEVSAFAVAIAIIISCACMGQIPLDVNSVDKTSAFWNAAARLGNVLGVTSNVIWFVVLWPQIIHNQKQKSVEHLSLAWLSLNYMAPVLHGFHVWRAELPFYYWFGAVNMGVLNYTMLIQYILLSPSDHDSLPHEEGVHHRGGYPRRKVAPWVLLLTLVTLAYAALNFFAPLPLPMLKQICWFGAMTAVTCWSYETIPQLLLNYRCQTCEGQAPKTIGIVFLGKSIDYSANLLLNTPPLYQFLAFFSTSCAYINVAQWLHHHILELRRRDSGSAPGESECLGLEDGAPVDDLRRRRSDEQRFTPGICRGRPLSGRGLRGSTSSLRPWYMARAVALAFVGLVTVLTPIKMYMTVFTHRGVDGLSQLDAVLLVVASALCLPLVSLAATTSYHLGVGKQE